jgi:predicted dehydrogenase
VGVLGTGAISQIVHLPILSERTDVDVLGVSDDDVHKARTISQRFEVPRVLSDQEMVESEEIQALVLCTPNHLHEEQAVAALEAGKHVLVERPMAFTPDGVERILDAARAADRTVAVGMSHRFRPDTAALRSFVAGGELGRIYAVRGAWLNRKIPLARTTWRQRPEEAGGGALMDLGVQALDLCLWLLDYPEVRKVKAVTHDGDFDVEDAASLLVELSGEIVLTLEVAWGYFSDDDRHYARVMGTEGSGSLPPLEIYKQLGGRPLEVSPRQPAPQGGENPYMNAYRREIDDFIRRLRGERDGEPPREQAALMALVQAAYRSAEDGGEVEL